MCGQQRVGNVAVAAQTGVNLLDRIGARLSICEPCGVTTLGDSLRKAREHYSLECVLL